jgi:uncharacterized iron-regulated membrane protein
MTAVRRLLLFVHRWFGLTIAGFLIMSGLTGAVISWDHELDDLLNADLTKVSTVGQSIASLELARRVETADPRIRVVYAPLAAEAGKSLAFFVEPRVDRATGQLHEVGYNQVFLDPATGKEAGRREWGKPALTRQNLISFLYVLHYSLHIPAMGGIDRWGVWLMGGIAAIWAVDCFVGFYLTLPRRAGRTNKAATAPWRSRWKPAWQVKWRGSARRVNFDLHRAAGLWLWAFLFLLAVSAVSLNLYSEVAQPLVSLVSDFTPSPYDLREPKPLTQPIEPQMALDDVVKRARVEAERRGWSTPAGGVSYASLYGVYAVYFHEPGGDHGAAGVGPPALYFDGEDGRYLGDRIPWTGTAGDLFLQVQFPLHSGRIAGVPGRIFISFMGLVVAMLSATGVVIWWQKRSASMLIAGRKTVQTPIVEGGSILTNQ